MGLSQRVDFCHLLLLNLKIEFEPLIHSRCTNYPDLNFHTFRERFRVLFTDIFSLWVSLILRLNKASFLNVILETQNVWCKTNTLVYLFVYLFSLLLHQDMQIIKLDIGMLYRMNKTSRNRAFKISIAVFHNLYRKLHLKCMLDCWIRL